MILQSTILKGNPRLDQVAAGGQPVRPAPPHDDAGAVSRIQKALRVLLKISMDKSFTKGPTEEPDGKYGEETFQAVIAFQKKVFPTDPSQWDGRVGVKTLTEMDKGLPAGGGGGTAPTAPTAPTAAFTVVPFTETSPFLISQQKDNRAKGDLDSSKRASLSHLPLTTQVKIAEARLSFTLTLEQRMLQELLLGGTLPVAMGTTFIRNASVQVVPFANGSDLSKAVRSSSVFPVAHNDVRDEITKVFKASIAARKVVDFHDLAEAKKVVTPPLFGFTLRGDFALKVAIGSFQGVDLFLSKFEASVTPRRWKATLIYDFFDHFGADDSDTILDTSLHGTPGQVALWVMQHERHPGHFPFISKVSVEIDVEDSL